MKHTRFQTRGRSLQLALVATWVALAACAESTRPATQVLVAVSSDLTPVSELHRVKLEVFDAEGETRASQASVRIVEANAGNGESELPLTFVVVERGGASFKLVVSGYGPEGKSPVVVHRSVVRFEPFETLLLQVNLARSCLGTPCTAERSCDPGTGRCEGIRVRDDLPVIARPDELDVDGLDGLLSNDAGTSGDAGAVADASDVVDASTVADASDDAAAMDGRVADASGADGGAADASEDDASARCAPDARCLRVPAGFMGPVVVAETQAPEDAPADCPSAFPREAFSAMHGLLAREAECECVCEAPTGFACESAGTLTGYDDAQCTVAGPSLSLAPGECTNISSVTSSAYLRASGHVADQGQCVPGARQSLPPVDWSGQVRGCAWAPDAAGDACGDSAVCVAAPASFGEGVACVWATGDQSCPAAYPERKRYHESFTDNRSCGECTCGDARNGQCAANVALRELCLLGLLGNLGGGCASPPLLASAGTLSITPEPGTCPPSAPDPRGGVSPDPGLTVCCE